MPEARALLGVAVDRSQQGVDIDERPLLDAGQQIGPRSEVDRCARNTEASCSV